MHTRPSMRSGPPPLSDDSWESGTTELSSLSGRRRMPRPVWALLALVVTGLVPAVGVPLIMNYYRGDRTDAQPFDPVAVSNPVPPPVPTGLALPVMTAPPPTLSGSTGAADPSVDSREPAVTGAQVADPEVTYPEVADPEVTDPPVPPPVLSPLSLEAEASGVELLKAQVVDVAGASGGRAVRFTGNSARIRFLTVPVAAQAPHRVTVWYAPAGTASMTIQGYNGPVAFTLPAGSGCCAAVTLLVPMAPGGQLTIRLTGVNGAYPAIDGVVIEAP